ncbi:MAG: hypothetical protein QOF51_2555 [Chloroflexota bacterium]|nr:hypothetical protein [Chloroflexota bacterium]
MTEQQDAVHLAGSALPRSRHVCVFYRGLDEADEILLPFIKEGIDRGEKIVHIIDPKQRDNYLRRLQHVAIDTSAAEASGQLDVRLWDNAYLRFGRFDQHGMLALLEEALTEGRAQGYPLTRILGHADWAIEDFPGVHDLVEYESRLNYVLPKYPDPVVCLYDLTKYDAEIVIDILRTHPTVVVGGVLQENPFYVPPDDFLRELQARHLGNTAHERFSRA